MMNGNGHGPAPTPWKERATFARESVVDIAGGKVQFLGRSPLAIEDDAMIVPVAHLLELAGQLLALMNTAHPAHAAFRQGLFSRQLDLLHPGDDPRT